MDFKQLADGTPPDIEATMSRPEAEEFRNSLEAVDFQETQTFSNVTNALDEDNNELIRFVIPGDEAGEVGEFITKLAEYLDGLNAQTIEKVENEADVT